MVSFLLILSLILLETIFWDTWIHGPLLLAIMYCSEHRVCALYSSWSYIDHRHSEQHAIISRIFLHQAWSHLSPIQKNRTWKQEPPIAQKIISSVDDKVHSVIKRYTRCPWLLMPKPPTSSRYSSFSFLYTKTFAAWLTHTTPLTCRRKKNVCEELKFQTIVELE